MLPLPEFVTRWKSSELTERSAAQSHFIDLCDVLGEPHPAACDQTGETYTFEKGVTTTDDTQGFADVWKRGCFAWEYQGKHKDLAAAYKQLLRYRAGGPLNRRPSVVCGCPKRTGFVRVGSW